MLDPRQVDSFSSLGVCQDKEHTSTQWRQHKEVVKKTVFSRVIWAEMIFCFVSFVLQIITDYLSCASFVLSARH